MGVYGYCVRSVSSRVGQAVRSPTRALRGVLSIPLILGFLDSLGQQVIDIRVLEFARAIGKPSEDWKRLTLKKTKRFGEMLNEHISFDHSIDDWQFEFGYKHPQHV